MPTLRISPEKVCFIVVKARELDVKVAPEWMDDGSNPTDDQMAQILEDYADDATLDELKSYLQALNEDELEDLLALTWLGRGDYTLADWEDLMSEVQDVRDRHTVDYLIGTPLLADYLENGLSEFGLSCAEFELGRMQGRRGCNGRRRAQPFQALHLKFMVAAVRDGRRRPMRRVLWSRPRGVATPVTWRRRRSVRPAPSSTRATQRALQIRGLALPLAAVDLPAQALLQEGEDRRSSPLRPSSSSRSVSST